MEVAFWIKVGAKPWGAQYFKAGPVKASRSKPALRGNEVAFRITLEIPDSVFRDPVFHAKLIIPEVKTELPNMAEVAKQVGEELGKRTGFRVQVDLPVEIGDIGNG